MKRISIFLLTTICILSVAEGTINANINKILESTPQEKQVLIDKLKREISNIRYEDNNQSKTETNTSKPKSSLDEKIKKRKEKREHWQREWCE